MVFFSKNKKTAMMRLTNLAKSEKKYKGKTVRLAKEQIPHISGWKTFKIVNKK